MRSIEIEGDTIDEAIANALAALRVERDRVEVEILGSATKGLFGFGSRRARIRATVRESLAATLRKEMAQDVSRGTSDSAPAEASEVAAPSPPQANVEAIARPVERAREVLEGILAHLGASCRIEARDGADSQVVIFGVSGAGSGLVIGRRGQTLDAIEYLLNRITARAEDEGLRRIVLDVEGYRERREESLEQLARRLARKVTQTGRVVTLNPMSPRDRRIVHLALQDSPGVVTRSQGVGYYRKVLILPEDRGGRPAPRASSER
jgi:spoIIIJ-associated protein